MTCGKIVRDATSGDGGIGDAVRESSDDGANSSGGSGGVPCSRSGMPEGNILIERRTYPLESELSIKVLFCQAVVRVDGWSIGKKLHWYIALKVGDAAIIIRHCKSLLGWILALGLDPVFVGNRAEPDGAGGGPLPGGGVAAVASTGARKSLHLLPRRQVPARN